MSQLSGSWRVALRAGRRDVLRSKGRSALIATMVGTPVLLTVMLSTIVTSNQISDREGIPDQMGAARAVATYAGGAVSQAPGGENFINSGSFEELTPAELVARLETASNAKVVPVERGNLSTVVGDRGYSSRVLGVDASQPITKGLLRVEKGRAPRSASEVLVTKALTEHGASIGSDVKVSETTLRVVGIGTIGSLVRGGQPTGIVVMPGAVAAATEVSYLIDRSSPITWADVKDLNAAGYVVVSRQVLVDPPPASELDDNVRELTSGSEAALRAILVIVVTAVVLEVVLLAGPAFAVGVRRQRRDLALMAAAGASPKQIRRIVLGQALVLGVLSCVLGAGLGIALSALVVRFGPAILPWIAFGPFEIAWVPIAAGVVLGAVASMTAAFVPARQASRQEVAAVLAGRRGTVRTSRGWPILGVVMIGASLAVCFTLGIKQGGELAVAAATVGIVVGAVFLTPLVIGLVARAGSGLPLPLRLAVRDTARQRARSAPAVAAVMAAVAGITTLAIASASDFEQNRRTYQYETSPGRMVIVADAENLDRAIDVAGKATGGIQFVPLGSANTDRGGAEIVNANGVGDVRVGDAATLAAWGVALTAEQRQTLADGGALVSDPDLAAGGQLQLQTYGDDDTEDFTVKVVAADMRTGEVPQGDPPSLYGAVISPATADELGIPWSATRAISEPGAPVVSQAVEDKVNEAVVGIAPDFGSARVERGFNESYALPFLALVGFGLLAVLVGTMTATGLALSDARPDFSTLAAVGAAPRTRRFVAGAQAIVLATLGTVLGIAVGFAPGLAATWPLTSASYAQGVEQVGNPVIEIPWLLLAVIAVAVPAFAALAAMVFTRSKLPVVRRLAQ